MRLVTVRSEPPSLPKQSAVPKRTLIAAMIVLLLLAGNYLRPLPNAEIALSLPTVPPPESVQLAWPAQGHAAVALDGYGVVATEKDTEPVATASIAKVITALCILEKHPLKSGEQGPILTISADDYALYLAETERNGSSLPVYIGETLSEYELLQALLIPSANNIANTAAVWAFGSVDAYRQYATAYVARNGLTSTVIGTDASGFDASTTSTAEDLAELGMLAYKNPVLMSIAGQSSAYFPLAGTVYNYNTALGTEGINGLKTGNNLQNPGGLLFTASIQKGSATFKISGAVLAAENLQTAITQSEQLVASVGQNLQTVRYVAGSDVVGSIRTAWGSSTPVVTAKELSLTRWKSQTLRTQTTTHKVSAGMSGEIGAVGLRSAEQETSVSLRLKSPVPQPSFWWRLTRL